MLELRRAIGIPFVTSFNDQWMTGTMMLCIDPRHDSQLLSVTPMGMRKAHPPACSRRRFAGWFAVVVILAAVSPMPAMPRAERHEIRHQIEQLEETWRNAVLHGNTTAMDALLADDYMAITPTGILQSKEQSLANLRAGTVHFKSIDLSDRKIRLYGSTALVTSRAEVSGSGPDGDLSGSYRYTRVYVKDEHGVWRIVSFEASKISQPAEQH
jgi:ketosteroid isomerase-like protein